MNRVLLISLFFTCSFSVIADDLSKAPESFRSGQRNIVFSDFSEAYYKINYNLGAQTASVEARIRLTTKETGFPAFDLVENPSEVFLDGDAVTTSLVSTPSSETKLRIIDQSLSPGVHELRLQVPLKNLVKFTPEGVRSAFWVTDLEDRKFLERYIPVNLEFDRVKMTFDIEFDDPEADQMIFANGKVRRESNTKAIIEFPEYFTVNSLYYHTTPKGSVSVRKSKYRSVSGTSIPLTIYTEAGGRGSASLENLEKKAQKVLAELEADYGDFPHPQVIIMDADLSSMGLGGMEYAGATVTNYGSLGHELFHSYFARGVTPANGNAGWIDEALASWRDNGYNQLKSLSGSSRMASHPAYTRATDVAAYSFGAKFMAYLDGKFDAQGGLKPFMRELLKTRIFSPLTTEDFIGDMELFFNEELSSLFGKFVYGRSSLIEAQGTHPVHRKLGAADLEKLL